MQTVKDNEVTDKSQHPCEVKDLKPVRQRWLPPYKVHTAWSRGYAGSPVDAEASLN